METLGYYNGKTGTLDEMTVPMLDRGCYFGDGVYEVVYSRNHVPYLLAEHIKRMFSSASMLGINIGRTEAELEEIIRTACEKVEDGSQHIYFQITRGTGIRTHIYESGAPGNLWIMIRPGSILNIYEKVGLITLEDKRYYYCNIKTLNLIPSVMYARQAAERGCYEAVLHRNGRVTECSHSNVHIIKDGALITPPADELILPGVARARLMAACKNLGTGVREAPFTLDELKTADEILVTSSSAPCLSASRLDGEEVGGREGGLLKKLQDIILNDFYIKTEK